MDAAFHEAGISENGDAAALHLGAQGKRRYPGQVGYKLDVVQKLAANSGSPETVTRALAGHSSLAARVRRTRITLYETKSMHGSTHAGHDTSLGLGIRTDGEKPVGAYISPQAPI